MSSPSLLTIAFLPRKVFSSETNNVSSNMREILAEKIMAASPDIKKPIKSLDLFCGIGGLTLGLHRAGFECLGGADIWEEAGNTFQHNHPDIPFTLADLTQVKSEELLQAIGSTADEVDVIVGGPPCQGFSTVGKRNVSDPRNVLWTHYLELVRDIRPAYLVIENVEGMNVMSGGAIRDGIISAFGEVGYRMKSTILTSADYGVPQLRKRIVFLGWLPGVEEPGFPEPTKNRTNWVSVRDAIFDLPPLGSGEKTNAYASPPLTDYQREMRGAVSTLNNHEAANHPKELVEVLRHIPDGGNRTCIPDELQPKSGFHNSYARLASWKPAVAVTSNMRKPSSARATHPMQERGLTVREGLRLQSFPDDFVVLGSRTSQYLQVGNAVPPKLAEAIGNAVSRAFWKTGATRVAEARREKPIALKNALQPTQAVLFNV